MNKIRDIINSLGVFWSCFIVTILCVLASVLVSVGIGYIFSTKDLATLIVAAMVCPALIAPPVVYLYAKLNVCLEESKRNQEELNRVLEEFNRELSDAFDQVKDEKRFMKICRVCQDVTNSRWDLDYLKQTSSD